MEKSESTLHYFLSGRAFTSAEIQDIQETIDACGLNWHELVQTICEHLDWVTPAGQYKVTSCTNALRMLEAKGLLKLPPKPAFKGSKQKIILGEPQQSRAVRPEKSSLHPQRGYPHGPEMGFSVSPLFHSELANDGKTAFIFPMLARRWRHGQL